MSTGMLSSREHSQPEWYWGNVNPIGIEDEIDLGLDHQKRGIERTNRTAETSPLIYARAAGFAYLIIIIAGIFAQFFVRSSLIVWGDAATTANNIVASEGLFRIGFAADLVVFLSDIVLSVLLYVLLKPVNKTLALLAAFFRLTHASILGINLLNHYFALLLLSGADYLTVFETDQLHALVLLFLNAHNYGYLIGGVFFGLSLFVLSYLVFKSGYFPRFLGVLLVFASLGYLIDSFGNFLLPNYAAIFSMVVLVPAVIAEFSLCLWLLLKGVNVQQWDNKNEDTVAT